MGSHQPATNTSGRALPVCLYGIGIHPQVQPSNRRDYHQRHNEVTRPMHSRGKKPIKEQDSSSTEEATLDQRLDQMTLNEVPLGHPILKERPRHALALQMADLDHRRETIKKHKSKSELVNSMDEQRTFLEPHSNRMHSVPCVMMQDPSFQFEFVTDLQRHNCAKAA